MTTTLKRYENEDVPLRQESNFALNPSTTAIVENYISETLLYFPKIPYSSKGNVQIK